MATERAAWIDWTKGIAILAVCLDHLIVHYPSVGKVIPGSLTYWSVALFVLVGGMNNAAAADRDGTGSVLPRWKGIVRLLLGYAAASVVFRFFLAEEFGLADCLRAICTFSAASIFYFVAFYLQLLLIAPLLYRALQWLWRKDRRLLLAGLPFVLLLSHLCVRHTFDLPLYGGGRFLFGGYFLFAFVLGMAFHMARRDGVLPNRLGRFGAAIPVALLLVGGLLLRPGIRSAVGKALPKHGLADLIYMINPSGLCYLGIAVAIGLSVFLLKDRLPAAPLRPLALVGRCSLTIFLFHRLILILGATHFENEGLVAAGACLVAAVLIPMALSCGFSILKKICHRLVSAAYTLVD